MEEEREKENLTQKPAFAVAKNKEKKYELRRR
jgi:hypothetical protein